MIALFWIVFSIAIMFAIATVVTMCIRKTRQQFIHIYLNMGLAVCAVICSIINFILKG